jgi:hypothetical protein
MWCPHGLSPGLASLAKSLEINYDLAQTVTSLMKNFLVESGGNGRFRHEMPKVIPQILTRLKYTAFSN